MKHEYNLEHTLNFQSQSRVKPESRTSWDERKWREEEKIANLNERAKTLKGHKVLDKTEQNI